MKKFILAIALIFSTKIFAISVDNFCSNFDWDNEKIQCYKAANLGFIDENALDVCQNISFDSNKMQCLNSLLNKTYTAGELRICRDSSFDTDKINCLTELGKRYNRPIDRQLEIIRKLAIAAKDSLRINDLYNTQRLLDEILKLTGLLLN